MKEINSLNPLNMNIPGGGFSSRDRSERLKKAVTEFEALFLSRVLKAMRKMVNKSEHFDAGNGEGTYNSLFDEELSDLMAKSGGFELDIALLPKMEGSSKGAKVSSRGRVKKAPERALRKRAYGGKK